MSAQKLFLAAIEAGFPPIRSGDLEVRLAALAHMGENVGDRGREVLTALLATDDAGVRLSALDLVASMGVVAAGPWMAGLAHPRLISPGKSASPTSLGNPRKAAPGRPLSAARTALPKISGRL